MVDDLSKTALFVAAEKNHYYCLELLFGKSCIDQNISDKDGNTPLIIAAKNGYIFCVDILLRDKYFNKDYIYPETREQIITTSLCNSITERPIPILAIKMIFGFFQKETLIDKQNNKGETALFLAAEHGKLSCVRILLYYKCNKNITDKKGKTPLQIAQENVNQACVNALSQ